MMSKKQFDDLWGGTFGPLLPTMPIPDYNDYLLREGMLEDYLDIFRGYSTREREGAIKMPYPHPFFNADGTPKLAKKPCIKYILVGEAPPRLNPPIYNNCTPIAGDTNNTYIYDIRHVGLTPWLTSLKIAFGARSYTPCPSNKVECLLDLAAQGVYLIDLFHPFAIPFTSSFRARLNLSGVTLNFWNNPLNPDNLQDRINSKGTLLCKEWDLSLVAPYKISEYIVNPANGFPPLAIVPPGLHPATFRLLLPDPLRFSGCPFKKVCISGAGFPTAYLINLSF
jgi:hypothetical protein